MFCFPIENYSNQFSNKILTKTELLETMAAHFNPPQKVHPKRVMFKAGDKVKIRAKVPPQHNSFYMTEDATGTVIDVAPYGGNGAMMSKNGLLHVCQEPIYKIKLDKVVNVIAVGYVDEIIGFNTSLMTKI